LICQRQINIVLRTIIDNRIYEPMVFCYIPSLILLYYLGAKNCSFFIEVMEKTGIVPVVFCRIAKIECYFYDNRIYGIFFLIVYFLAYLYGLYKGFLLEIFFLFFRLLLNSYFSFRLFFRVEHENLDSTQFLHYSFFQTFYKFNYCHPKGDNHDLPKKETLLRSAQS